MARQDIGYDFEDFGMTAEELEAKYTKLSVFQQHSEYTRLMWQTYKAMPTRDVKLPYWDWVVTKIAADDDNIDSVTDADIEDLTMVPIESVDQFAFSISTWHGHVLARLNHLLEMPEGQTVTIEKEGEPAQELVLEGDAFKGFKAAMLTAIMQFDSLPFSVSVDQSEDAGDASAQKH